MKNNEIRPEDVFYPVIMTPVGKVPLIGSTMTDEKEREIAEKYPVLRAHDVMDVVNKKRYHSACITCSPVRQRRGRYSY